MAILVWIVFGLVVGVVARSLMPGRDPMGCPMVAVLGMVGVMGAFLGRAAGWSAEGEPAGFLLVAGGVVLLLPVYRAARRRSDRVAAS